MDSQPLDSLSLDRHSPDGHPSDSQDLVSLAERFAIDGPVTAVEPLGNGNVNDTYCVRTASGSRSVLQRLNTRVFPRPELVMGNLEALAAHVAAHRAAHGAAQAPAPIPGAAKAQGVATGAGWPSPGRRWEVPRPLPLRDGRTTWLRSGEEAWRMLSYVEGARSFETVQGPDHAREVGRALGTFHQLIHDLPAHRLADTLEGFHITPGYLAQYQRVLERSPLPRCPATEWCVGFVRERQELAPVLERAKAAGRLQIRPIHGDPKVNNVMVCQTSGRAVALVDLDTVKPGLIHYDIGDCLRSGCNPLGEETRDLEGVAFDLELCRAMLGGYLAECRASLSDADIAHLYDAIRLIPFELGLRFLSDHLAGNVYFKVRHGRHNLDRARVQFRLVESIEAQEGPIRSLIDALL